MNTGRHTDCKTIKNRTYSAKAESDPNGAFGRILVFGLVGLGAIFVPNVPVFGDPAPVAMQPEREEPGRRSGREGRKSGWSIVVGAVVLEETPGEPERLASEALERVRSKGRLSEAQMERRGRSLVIYYGDYENPETDRAVADLAKIRGMEVDGAMPYSRAYLAPPPDEAMKGAISEYDLRNVRQSGVLLGGGGSVGRTKLLYTLQVGVYGRADGGALKPDELAEARAAAEKAAVQLRREGEMAYYYHAPTLSSVTVGLFSADELASKDPRAIPGQTVDTPELALLRKLHPHNLLNGQGIVIKRAEAGGRDRTDAKSKALQPSFLVEVPK